jgi:hypothetical protein
MTKVTRIEALKQIIHDQILIKADFGFWDGFASTSIHEEFEVEYNGDVLCTVKAYVYLEVIKQKVDAEYFEYPENGECKITIESIKLLDTVWSGTMNPCFNITNALRKEYGQETILAESQKELLENLFKKLAPQIN